MGLPWLVHRRFLVLARDLRGALPESPEPPGMRWGLLTEAEHDVVARLCRDTPERELARRWREGLECFGGWLDGRLVYCRWESRTETYLPYLGRRLCPAPGDVLVVDKFVDPSARGRGISAAASARALRRAREQGLLRSVALVAWWNLRAARATRSPDSPDLAGSVGFWHLGVGRLYFAGGRVRLSPDGRVRVEAAQPAATSVPGRLGAPGGGRDG